MEDLSRLILKTASALGLTEDASSAAAEAYEKHPNLAASFLEKGTERGFFKCDYRFVEKRYGGAFALAVTLLLATRAKKEYERFGIPDKVFWDTMSDICIWEHNYFVKNGRHGIGALAWLKLHFNLEIFRLGRLQFQKVKLRDPIFLKAKGAGLGDGALFVHIPQGEPLAIEKVKESFVEANDFFDTYFPEFCYGLFVTESWLLYGKNRLFMKEDSNILRFSALFVHLGDKNLQKEATKRIFGEEYHTKNHASSLEKAAAEYQKNGGKFGVGVGYLEKDKLSEWKSL